MSLLAAATARLAQNLPAVRVSVPAILYKCHWLPALPESSSDPRALPLAADLRPDGREGKPALEASVQREAVIPRIPSICDLLL